VLAPGSTARVPFVTDRGGGIESPPVFGRAPAPPRSGAGTGSVALALAACAFALALAGAGCGGTSAAREGVVRGDVLTIYSSLPFEGPDRAAALDVLRGERLALAHAGGRVGRHHVRLVSLDAANPQTRRWDPSLISRNARRAAADPSAVAYVGELDDGSSAISIPLLNQAGMLQLSPLDGALAFTVASQAIAGSPERYYPRWQQIGRTFARLVPSDRVQARALLALLRGRGATRLALLGDEDATGAALLGAVRTSARASGTTLVVDKEIDGFAQQHRDLVAQVVAARPDAVLYAGGQDAGGTAILWRELHAADPSLTLLAPASLTDPAFLAGVGAAGAVTIVTAPVLPLGAYPAASRRVAHAFQARYGVRPRPEALYGYEAIRVLLAALRDAQARAGRHALTRAEVVRALFSLPPQDGAIGPYAIDRRGDASLRRFGIYRVQDGALRFAGEIVG
jgi:branched-chain amino acid transport system substrate-binding protein